MDKLDSKLFQEFKLENKQSEKVIGGLADYTQYASDTSCDGGTGYDTIVETCHDGNTVQDTIDTTHRGTDDIPLPKN